MSRITLAGVRSRLETIDSRIPGPILEWGARVSKFVLCSSVGLALWLEVLHALSADPTTNPISTIPNASGSQLALVVAIFIAPPVAAVVVHDRLPPNSVDIYHRFGKSAALFVTVNVAVSMIVLAMAVDANQVEFGQGAVLDLIAYWALSSALLPGPYLGVLAAARWVRE